MPKEKLQLREKFAKMVEKDGNVKESRITVSEALTTADANILIPKVVKQVLSEASEPVLLASEFFNRVDLPEGRSMEFVHFGAIRAFEIAEGQELIGSSLVA